MDQKTYTTYSFGPRETRGIVLGLRAGQLAALGVGVLGAVAAIRSGPGVVSLLAGMLIASLMGLVALMPVGHLTIEQWAPAVAGYAWRGLAGQRRWASRSHPIAHLKGSRLGQPQPRSLQGVELMGLGPILAGGREMGYLKDRRRAAYVAVLAVRGDSFALLDRAEQDLRVRMWSSVIAGFGLRSSVIRRLQWVDRTLPEDRESLDRYLEDGCAPDADPEAVGSYRELIEQATSAAQRHEGFLAVQIDQRRVWKQARQVGDRDLDKVAGLMLQQQLRELEGIRLTQGYGPTDVVGEPIINGIRFHTGWDLACPAGTAILSVTAGRAHMTLGYGAGSATTSRSRWATSGSGTRTWSPC